MRVLAIALTVALVGAFPAVCQTLPEIKSLSPSDPIFAQHIDQINAGESAPLTVVEYVPNTGETFYGVAARLQLNPATLASLNRLSTPDLTPGEPILVPDRNGIFIPGNPETPLELLLARRSTEDSVTATIPDAMAGETFLFVPGAVFTNRERLVFSGAFLSPPLTDYTISSPFGPRTDPITGQQSFHEGVDLAAPFGTPVRAAASGDVALINRDRVLGLSVYIDHGEGLRTRYAHLQASFVAEGDNVQRGSVIGEVGSTGYSTGPHLHFEVIVDDRPVNPLHFISVD